MDISTSTVFLCHTTNMLVWIQSYWAADWRRVVCCDFWDQLSPLCLQLLLSTIISSHSETQLSAVRVFFLSVTHTKVGTFFMFDVYCFQRNNEHGSAGCWTWWIQPKYRYQRWYRSIFGSIHPSSRALCRANQHLFLFCDVRSSSFISLAVALFPELKVSATLMNPARGRLLCYLSLTTPPWFSLALTEPWGRASATVRCVHENRWRPRSSQSFECLMWGFSVFLISQYVVESHYLCVCYILWVSSYFCSLYASVLPSSLHV